MNTKGSSGKPADVKPEIMREALRPHYLESRDRFRGDVIDERPSRALPWMAIGAAVTAIGIAIWLWRAV